jgi:hypothetical protein
MMFAATLAALATTFVGPVFPEVPPATSPPKQLIALGGGHPGAMALATSGLWVTVYGGRGHSRLVRIDPAMRRVTARISLHGSPFYVAARGNAVWVTGNLDRRDDVLYRIDPRKERVVATIPLPGHYAGRVAPGPRGPWILTTNHDVTREWLVRVDPATNEVVRSVLLPTVNVQDLAVGERFVWLLALRNGRRGELPGDVLRFDPRAARVTAQIDAEALTMGLGREGLWISGCIDCGQHRRSYFAQRIDSRRSRPQGPRIGVRGVGFGPLFVGGDRVWFAGYGRSGGPIAFSLDPGSLRIERFLSVGRFLYSGVAFDRQRRALWVSRAAGGVLRVDLAEN